MNEDAKLILEMDGGDVEAEVLFTCNLEETGKNYVVFVAPNPQTGKKEISACVYNEADDFNGSLSPVETDEEWNVLDEYFRAFVEENDLDVEELLK